MKYQLLAAMVFTVMFANAQQQIGTLAICYFDSGNEARQKRNYEKADSFYTESLKWGTYASTYFNRALSRKAYGNDPGYCADMAEAASMGDLEAWKLHCPGCGTWTELYKDASDMTLLDSAGYATKLYVQGSPYFQQYFYTTVDVKGDTLEDFVVFRSGDTVCNQSKNFTPAQFPDGWEKFDAYMKEKMYYPYEARRKNIQGRVVIAYNVSDEGTITDIRLVRGIEGLNDEALRFMRMLPRFVPAKRNGIAVKSCCRMPIEFNLYEDTHVYWQRHYR